MEPIKGSYVWSCKHGRAFSLETKDEQGYSVHLGTWTDLDGAEQAIQAFCFRRGIGSRFNTDGVIEAFKHLPGSRTGAVLCESVGRFQLTAKDGLVNVARVS